MHLTMMLVRNWQSRKNRIKLYPILRRYVNHCTICVPVMPKQRQRYLLFPPYLLRSIGETSKRHACAITSKHLDDIAIVCWGAASSLPDVIFVFALSYSEL